MGLGILYYVPTSELLDTKKTQLFFSWTAAGLRITRTGTRYSTIQSPCPAVATRSAQSGRRVAMRTRASCARRRV